MKKHLLFFIVMIFSSSILNAQVRYLDRVFSSATVSSNIVYAHNIGVLYGAPADTSLLMDVYEPAGDTASARPLIIYVHPGTFLPAIYNHSATGTMWDS